MEDINKNINKKVIVAGLLVAGVVAGFGGMYLSGVFDTNSEEEMEQTSKNAVVCFMDKDPEDAVATETKDGEMINYEVVKLEFIDDTNQVKGVYNVVPFSSEATRGEFTGVLEGEIFKTDYTYVSAGQEQTKKQEFKLGSGGLLVGEAQKFLPKVNCADTEFQQNIKTFSLQ